MRYIYPHPYSFLRSNLTGGDGSLFGGGGGTQTSGGEGALGCTANGMAGSSMTGGGPFNVAIAYNFGGGTMKYYFVLRIFSYFFYLKCVLKKIIFLRINIFHVCILIGAYSRSNQWMGGIFFLNRLSVFLKVHPH